MPTPGAPRHEFRPGNRVGQIGHKHANLMTVTRCFITEVLCLWVEDGVSYERPYKAKNLYLAEESAPTSFTPTTE